MSTLADKKIVTMRDQIADQLRSDIIAGDLPPNTKLNEQALSSRFSVSRGPIRDVILQLSKEGLLVSKTNAGATVNSPLSPELQQLMIEMRRKIEAFAVKKLRGNMTDEDFVALDILLDRLRDAFEKQDFTEVTKTDIAFHQYLVQRAGGDDLTNIWRPIIMRMRMNYKRIAKADEAVAEHKAIADALRNNSAKEAIAALKINIK